MIQRSINLNSGDELPQNFTQWIKVALSKKANVNLEVISSILIGSEKRGSKLVLTIDSETPYDDYHKN